MQDERIVIDDNIITSFCPETAVDVGFALLSHLVGAERAESEETAWRTSIELISSDLASVLRNT